MDFIHRTAEGQNLSAQESIDSIHGDPILGGWFVTPIHGDPILYTPVQIDLFTVTK
jgi:hypothetical protein